VIRKFIFSIFLMFVLSWFAGAYLVKSRLLSLIEGVESDNIKISYLDSKISGFPGNWKIHILSPTIKIISHIGSRELSAKELICMFDFSFKKIIFDFGRTIKYTDETRDKLEYILSSERNLNGLIKFNNPLYSISWNHNLREVIKLFKIDPTIISMSLDQQQIFEISDLTLLIRHSRDNKNEKFFIQSKALYKSLTDLQIREAKFDLNMLAAEEIPTKNKTITINRLNLNFDEAEVDLNGDVTMNKDELPKGKLLVNLVHYNDIIDKFVPTNFIISRTALKNLISRAEEGNDIITEQVDTKIVDNADFEVEFSKNGIKVGAIELINFKGGDENGSYR